MQLTSPAFKHNGRIPDQYTCTGKDTSPPLLISGVPENAKTLVLIMDDPDAPGGTWDHWIIWNISPDVSEIVENSVPDGAVQGANSWGRSDYGGPCPPSGTHRYAFELIAVSDVLSLAPGSDKQTLRSALQDKVLDSAQLIGLYSKS